MTKIKNFIKFFRDVSILKYIYYNYVTKQVKREKKYHIIPYRHSVVQLEPGAQVVLNGNLFVNNNRMKGSKAEAYVKLLKDAKLIINGDTKINYYATIEVHEKGEVSIGSAYINSGAVILCAKRIEIGNEVLISRDVYIYDSDHHNMINGVGEKSNPSKDVIIGDHVWIGIKSTILRGVTIGEGAVIAANSVVMKKVKPHMLVSGSPARVFMEVNWK